MPLTPAAKKRAQAAEAASLAVQKEAWRSKLEKLMGMVVPPLRNSELSAGLGLQSPGEGASAVARFVSASPRYRRARPDTATRALIDLLLDGELLLAVQQAATPGARRTVLVCETRDVAWLGPDWELVNCSGGAIPARGDDWEEGWDLFAGDSPEPVQAVERRLLGRTVPWVGLGCMRLSTLVDRDDEAAIALLIEAIARGVRLLDTADSYALDESDIGHNERLVRRADPGPEVVIATKVGLMRPGGRWIPNGRPEHLLAAARASLERLGRIDLLQLHAVHDKVPIQDSVAALAELLADGEVGAVGLCNVDVAQIEAARAICPIASVQNAISIWEPKSFQNGVAEYCAAHDIALIAHSPLGGHRRAARRARDARLVAEADKRSSSVQRMALGWLADMGVLSIPGCTRIETLQDAIGATPVRLDGAIGWARDRRDAIAKASMPPPEVRIVMGSPASGKTSSVGPLVDKGYLRLNRDERGGRLDDLVPALDRALEGGAQHVVLDNTYPTRASRKKIVDVARKHGLAVHCTLIDIPIGEALFNASQRMLEKKGRLLGPDEIAAESRVDPNLFPPRAIFAFQQRYEPPKAAEFDGLEIVPFSRRPSGTRKAVILDLDGTLRTAAPAPFPRNPSEVRLMPYRREVLQRFVDDGYLLCAVTNQAGVALGQLTEQDAIDCIERTKELLGLEIDVRYCPHRAGGTHCWCRKPMPGLGVQLLRDHDLDRSLCVFVGDRDSDAEFARNLGVRYADQAEFFQPEGGHE